MVQQLICIPCKSAVPMCSGLHCTHVVLGMRVNLVLMLKQLTETCILHHSVLLWTSVSSLHYIFVTEVALGDRRAHAHWTSPRRLPYGIFRAGARDSPVASCGRILLRKCWRNDLLYISTRTLLLYQMWDKKKKHLFVNITRLQCVSHKKEKVFLVVDKRKKDLSVLKFLPV